MHLHRIAVIAMLASGLGGYAMAGEYDIVIQNGLICDGSGDSPYSGDVAIQGDTIAGVGKLADTKAKTVIDAKGKAVAPGFINMLSWANESLLHDGRSQSDIRQGVTLEVLGEGTSMGPWSDAMKKEERERQDEIRFDIDWTTLGEYLSHLEKRGVSTNVASFVGATTVRIHEIGYANRPPTPDELDRMKALVRQAMEEGAVGVSTSLIYSPAFYAKTDELVALAQVAAEYDGLYISHIRNEGDKLFEALDEFLDIARRAKIRAEVYHIKASGRKNWAKMDEMLKRIEAARAEGLHITADMYPYHASSTGLDAIMPPWVQEGGHKAWVERLKDPAIRERVKREMKMPSGDWDNGMESAGSAKNILLVGFRSEALRPLTGKTLEEVAAMRKKSPQDMAMDLVIEDDSRVGAVFFSMSEDNIRKEIRVPWISFCSDGGSIASEGVFLNRQPHPRAYGTFARVFSKYVRDEKLVPIEQAVRRLTSLPAENLRIQRRGRLKPGFFADVVVFDPAKIQDHATFDKPHQYATGVVNVFVNGVQVIANGEHTGAKPAESCAVPSPVALDQVPTTTGEFTVTRCSRFSITIGLLGFTIMVQAREAKDHPNIVILFVDQLRWSELGCYGNPVIHSPNLDRLASDGVQFTKGFTNFPSCSPARSTLLSGRYARSNGVYANQGPAPIDSRPTNRDTTLPEALAADGYATAMIGKWHLDPHPRLLGFQKSWIGGTGPGYEGYMRGPWKVDGDPSGDYFHEGWTLDHQAELADRFLRQNKERPFFLYLTPSPPHMPIASLPDKYKKMYDAAKMPLRLNVWKDGELPFDPRWFGIYLGEGKPPELPPGITLRDLYALYYGQITAVDDWVGKVLESIHSQGLDENTIVLFSADHGDLLGSHHRFNKNEHYDEACRIPFLIRWNGVVKPTVQDAQIISQVDVTPTFLDLCGVKKPESVQGTSIASVLLGKQSTAGENVAYIETTVNEGIRTDRFVYWCRRHGRYHEHLFDTSCDPFEINDVIADPRYKEIAAELREKTSKWQERTPSVPAAASHPNEN